MSNYMLGYLLVVLGTVIMLFAQAKVQGAYRKYSKVNSLSGLTGEQVARHILDQNGLYDVKVGMVRGQMTDHYNPQTKVVNLSQGVYNSHSIAAIAIAAHEVGHAIQHAQGYKSLVIRNTILPIVNLGQTFGMAAIFIGLLSSAFNIAMFGVFLVSGILVFQLITLPVEFNASKRALTILSNGMISSNEVDGARSMLTAAALTYVAAAISTLFQILRLLLLVLGNRRD